MLVFSHLSFFQRHETTCGISEKPISWPLLWNLLLLLSYTKYSILLLSSLLLLFFLFFVFSSYFPPFYASFIISDFSLLLFSLFLFFFVIPAFLVLVSTTFHISLDTLSSLLFLFSSQFQDCNKLTIIFPKLHSTFVFQSHWSLFSLCVLGWEYRNSW